MNKKNLPATTTSVEGFDERAVVQCSILLLQSVAQGRMAPYIWKDAIERARKNAKKMKIKDSELVMNHLTGLIIQERYKDPINHVIDHMHS